MSVDLNLADWMERRAGNLGSYSNHIIHSVRAYEAEIRQLRERVARWEPSTAVETGSWPATPPTLDSEFHYGERE